MILITGNAGFIGKYLTTTLLKAGFEVQGIDIRPRQDSERGFIQIDGSILDKDIVKQSMTGIDCIIHLAAEHKDFGITETDYFRVNEQGTKVLLEEASDANIKKFIFYSSVAVYGAQSNTKEETPPASNNPYGASKLAAERLITAWAKEDSTRTAIIIRPTVVFGPNSKANIFRLIRQVCDGKFIMVGNGKNIKSIAYVENLVDATLYLMERCSPGTNIYNYADEPHLQTKDLVNLIGMIAERKPSRFYIPLNLAIAGGIGFDLLGKITGIDFSVTSARMKKFTMPTHHRAERIRLLGFIPKYSIEEGLKRNIDWYLKKKKTLSEYTHSSD
ncbi:MAG: NAD(P)-dependent oxidoreductase [Bacteroidota bacterium]